MNPSIVFNQVAVLFLIMAVGFYSKKKDYINEEVNTKLSELLLNITLPFLVLNSFQFDFSKDKLYNAALVLIISLCIHLFSVFLGMFLHHKYDIKTKSVLKFVTVFSNCAYMGFPVLQGIFGQEGIFYGSIYTISFNIFLWTYGVMVYSGKKDFRTIKQALINPGIIAVYIGLVTFFFSIKFPTPLFKAFDIVGGMTTPISMLIIGALLADVKLKTIFSGFHIYWATVIRLIAIPLITLLVLKFIGISGIVLAINVVCSAMPAAATTAIFAQKYNGDAFLASKVIVFSTLLSLITIPLIIILL